LITELEFKSLGVAGYNRIPLIAEAFADLETPLSLYLKLAGGQPLSFLLESVVGGERFGRYSFIGLPARTLLRATGLKTEIVTDGQVVCAEAGGVEGEQKAGLEEFKTKFKAKFNTDVQIYAPYVYDAVNVMVAAMVKADSADPAKYLPELAKTEGFKGVTGTISFDEKGDVPATTAPPPPGRPARAARHWRRRTAAR